MSAARPFKLFGERERTLLRGVLEERCRDWAARWAPGGAGGVSVECVAGGQLAGRLPAGIEGWRAFAAGEEWWALAERPGTMDELGKALLGAPGVRDERASPLAAAVAGDALHELFRALLGRDPGPRFAVQPAWDGAGSASCAAAVTVGGACLHLVSSASWTLRALKQRASPPPAVAGVDGLGAVGGQAIDIEVLAGSAEVALGELLRLRPGSVIALDTRVDRPVAVLAGPRKAPWCSAHLGARGAYRAVALKARR